MTALRRFSQKYEVDVESGCWNWTAAKGVGGYGRFRSGGREPIVLPHRWSYEHYVGPIPDGLQIDHLCRNPSCVNPAHLEAVTASENCQRASPDCCPHGHPYTDENTSRWADGKKRCRECKREKNRAAYYRRKENK